MPALCRNVLSQTALPCAPRTPHHSGLLVTLCGPQRQNPFLYPFFTKADLFWCVLLWAVTTVVPLSKSDGSWERRDSRTK